MNHLHYFKISLAYDKDSLQKFGHALDNIIDISFAIHKKKMVEYVLLVTSNFYLAMKKICLKKKTFD